MNELFSSVDDRRLKAIIKYCTSPDVHLDDKAALFRETAENDFWFFCRYATSARHFVCYQDGCKYYKRHVFDHPYIFDFCREIQEFPNGYLVLRPRGHLKTTIGTVYQTMWDFAKNLRPQPTFAIVTWKIEEVGESFVDGLKQEMEPGEIDGTGERRNAVLAHHWPEVFWQDPVAEKAPVWKRGRLNLKTHPGTKEDSISMMGLNALRTSKHFTHIVYDDIVTEESAANPDACRDCTVKFRKTTALAHPTVKTKRRGRGTRWARDDTYQFIIDNGILKVLPGTWSCYEEDGETSVLHPGSDWLDEWRVMLGPTLFAANMENRPIDEGSTFSFSEDWLKKRYYTQSTEEVAEGANLYFFVDPAKLKEGSNTTRKDFFSIWGLALRSDGKRYVIEMIRDKLTASRAEDLIFSIDKKWRERGNPIKMWWWESRGASLDIEYFYKCMELRNYRSLNITEFYSTTKKDNRIMRLIRPWEAGEIILPSELMRWTEGSEIDMVSEFITQEFKRWRPSDGARWRPNIGARNDDLLDAASQSEDPSVKSLLEYPTEDIEESWVAIKSKADLERQRRNQTPGAEDVNPWAC